MRCQLGPKACSDIVRNRLRAQREQGQIELTIRQRGVAVFGLWREDAFEHARAPGRAG